MNLTIKNIEIYDIKEWGHSDGYDQHGKFTATYRNLATLMVKGKGLIIPIMFHFKKQYSSLKIDGERICINILEGVSFEDLLFSALHKKALQNTEDVLGEYNINKDDLRKLVIEKLSIDYPLSKRLREKLKE